jgi:HlyD family secretion protein
VNANVDEADIGNISDQADVRFTVDAFPNEFFRGTISEIRLNPQTVQNVVTYSVIISIRNPDLKLKPGMTANITVTVDQRENVLKVPNAALRYTPSGMRREQLAMTPATWSASSKGDPVDSRVSDKAQRTEPSPSQLAPGQKWNPADKIKMVPPKRVTQRPGLVFVLNSEKKPEARNVVLGITDGSLTEVVSGDLMQGNQVIIGDTTQTGGASPSFTPFGGFGQRGGAAPAGGRGR